MNKAFQKITNLITFLFFILFSLIVGIIPYRALYLLSDFLAWLLRSLLKYRIKVVQDNLAKTGYDPKDKQLIQQIYRNLSDIMLEGMKSFFLTPKSVRKRHRVTNPEVAQPWFDKGQSVILATGHIGNWEWGSLSAGLFTPFRIVGIYRPLKNPMVDAFLRWSRSRFGTVLCPTRQTSLCFEKHAQEPCIFLMAADQSPAKIGMANWVTFLGRETPFIHGPEKHAQNNSFPVIYAHIERVRRGHYEVTLEEITRKPQALEKGEITRLYAQKLELSIRKNPEQWLWTHKRWKRVQS